MIYCLINYIGIGFPLFIAFWISIALIVAIKEFGKIVRIFYGFLVGIYIIGLFFFFNLVKISSNHGNTIHGWYSKYNTLEKISAWAWIIIIPPIIIFLSWEADKLIKVLFNKKNKPMK